MFNKLAQISIFIIISTIIVLLGIGYITFSSDMSIFRDETSSYQVSQYVEACIQQQLDNGIDKMGRQGGWLYPPEEIYFTKRGDIDQMVKNAQGVQELSVNKIPYWHYYDDTNEEFKNNYIPSYDSDEKNSMRMQLKRYLDETLEEQCLKDFETFEDSYNIDYDKDNINHEIEFLREEIIVDLNLPIEIDEVNAESTQYVEDFSVEGNNKLRTPYYLARDIANAMNENYFLNRRVMEMLYPYMTKQNRELLPPTYDFDLKYDAQPWFIPDVKKTLKRILSTNIGRVQLLETNSVEEELPSSIQNSQLAQGINNMYSKYYLGNPQEEIDHSLIRDNNPEIFEDYKNYRTIPTFQTFYPLSLEISPSTGNVVVIPESDMFTRGLTPISTTRYQSSYDIKGPSVFTIENPNLENDDFEFRVAYEINIENNVPIQEKYPELQFSQDDIEQEEDNNEVANSLICERSQFVSKPVKVNLTNPLDNQNKGVEDVAVEFTCKNGIATCGLGQTQIDENGNTNLEINLPVNCEPGTLSFSKPRHESVEIDDINPNLNDEINLGEIEMSSTKELDLDISLVSPQHIDDTRLRGTMDSRDSGIIIFEHNDEEFVEMVEFENLDQDLSLELLPGDYSVSAVLLHEDEDLVIPEERRCEDAGPFSSDECYTLPEVELPTWLRGTYEHSSYGVSLNELKNSDSIEVKIFDLGIPDNYDQLEELSDKMEQVNDNSGRAKPQLK